MARETTESNRISRRRVLGGVGTTVAAAALSGVAAADRGPAPERRRVAEAFELRYATTEALHAAFETHAGDLLADLAARGLLDRGDADALSLASPTDPATYRDAVARGDTAVSVTTVADGDGGWTGDVSASMPTQRGRLTVHVRPGTGEAHAVLRGDDTTVFRQGEDGVETQSCPARYCECDWSVACQYGWQGQGYEVLCCEQGDGSLECSRSGDTCGCCEA